MTLAGSLKRLPNLLACTLLVASGQLAAETDTSWGVGIQHEYRLTPDITYLSADSFESKLDIIAPIDTSEKKPVLLYIHGGGWVAGDKNRMFLHFLPYLQMDMAVVNVGYRLGRVALAPAAVEDARCALRWVINNAEKYGLDANKIVVSGHSAGGHLSLATGILPTSAGLDARCPASNPNGGRADAASVEMPVAAVVNWFGITDVADLVEGPNAKTYAVAWMGGQPNWRDIATRVSPLSYIRNGLPAILTIHGDADTIVPFSHAERLHEELAKTNTTHDLMVIKGGGHGGFSQQENQAAMDRIQAFLIEQAILPGS